MMTSLHHVAKVLENTDTVNNLKSLKELMHRKGLNLRFEWLLLTKLRHSQCRELVMAHILMRAMKKIINEEVKLKAQVFTPAKSRPMPNSKSLADKLLSE